MKIYLAGERTEYTNMQEQVASVWSGSVKRRLFSFYYHGFSKSPRSRENRNGLSNDINSSIKLGHDLFLDSGAFTAFTKDVVIPVEEYAAYVREHRNIWTTCSSLDAIGKGREAALESFKLFAQLRNRGAQVQPVFHVREPDYALEYYIKEGWDYIFIGGMVPESTPWLMQRLDEIWTRYLTNPDGTAKVKIHGFGLTDSKLMFRYPWYSVDSSSWLMTGIFGSCSFRVNNQLRKVVFSDESPQARKFKGWHYNRLTPRQRDEVNSWIEPYGVTAEQLSQHYSFRDVINAAVFQGLENLGTERFNNAQPLLLDVA